MHDVIIAALSPLISELVGVAITALVGYAVKLLRDKTGIELDAKAQRDLHLALDSGAQVALAKLGVFATPDELKAEALAYARQSVPDAIKRLKPMDGVLSDLATAKVQAVIGGYRRNTAPSKCVCNALRT